MNNYEQDAVLAKLKAVRKQGDVMSDLREEIKAEGDLIPDPKGRGRDSWEFDDHGIDRIIAKVREQDALLFDLAKSNERTKTIERVLAAVDAGVTDDFSRWEAKQAIKGVDDVKRPNES